MTEKEKLQDNLNFLKAMIPFYERAQMYFMILTTCTLIRYYEDLLEGINENRS
jgi:hypothetical protein